MAFSFYFLGDYFNTFGFLFYQGVFQEGAKVRQDELLQFRG